MPRTSEPIFAGTIRHGQAEVEAEVAGCAGDAVEGCLAAAMAEATRSHAGNPALGPLFAQMTRFVLDGGKRLRPRLALASYHILSGDPGEPPAPVMAAAASLELFHAFMLVHDDLIDASTLRRGRPTLHEAFRLGLDDAEGHAATKRAGDLGLLAGDLLMALGMRMLNRSGLDDATLGRANRLVAEMLVETGVGEALDLLGDACPLDRLDEAPLIEAYLHKTARYTVSGPLVLGATIAGAGPHVCEALGRFGDLLGFGYQVRNDLAALGEDPARGDHADLDGGKRTFVLWMAYRSLDAGGREALVDALAAPASLERRYRLLALIRESGAVAACRDRLVAVEREAVAVLETAKLGASRRRAFLGLVELFRPSSRRAASTAAVEI